VYTTKIALGSRAQIQVPNVWKEAPARRPSPDSRGSRSQQKSPTVKTNIICVFSNNISANVFGSWLNGVDHRFKLLLRMGGLAIIWSLRLCRNEGV
jgi:hypothetical protein